MPDGGMLEIPQFQVNSESGGTRKVPPNQAPYQSFPGLEKRGCSPAPLLTLVLGNALHVFYIGACLRQDVMKIISDADEREALFQKLAHPRGAE